MRRHRQRGAGADLSVRPTVAAIAAEFAATYAVADSADFSGMACAVAVTGTPRFVLLEAGDVPTTDIVTRLNREVVDILKGDAMDQTIRSKGSEPAPTSPAEFDRFIASEILKWGKAVKASGATAD